VVKTATRPSTAAPVVGEGETVLARETAGTRSQVARALLERGPQTAATLGERLGLTPAAVRRHLDALLADGAVYAREPRVVARRGRGRPAKVFALTDSGRDAFEAAYDTLAVNAMRFLAETGGASAIAEFARRQAAAVEARLSSVGAAVDPPQALAAALTADGYAATIEPLPGGGAQLCQHHCPVAHVATAFPQLCEAETEAFARILGTHVQRLATIAHGDGICTTHIPPPVRRDRAATKATTTTRNLAPPARLELSKPSNDLRTPDARMSGRTSS
jgi:predicted ArsR family transcriptional regulator